MVSKHCVAFVALVWLGACSSSQTPADDPSGGGDESGETGESGESGEPGSEAGEGAAKPKDGIVRDADGDGVPDDKQQSGCEGKTETQCKINTSCAWSDDGKCVDAKAGM